MRLAKPLVSLALFHLASGAAVTCSNPPVRKEWRELGHQEKKEYIDAVHCLATIDSISDRPRKEHFSGVNGHFALWHRYFVASYEKALREECGYPGAQPYWNWSLDASSDSESTAIFESDIFNTCHGFGGNGAYVEITDPAGNPFNLTGRTGGGCLHHAGGGCLKRDFIPWIMNTFAQQSLVDHPNIHGSGHFGVGGVLGTIGNQYESPGDLETRLHQVGGPIEPMNYSGANVTLDFTVNIGALAGDATLEQLLNTRGNVLCYTYNTA
ncbi:hypothetical protein BJX64DRAFT_277574 [Aspergillus heterothallicus]